MYRRVTCAQRACCAHPGYSRHLPPPSLPAGRSGFLEVLLAPGKTVMSLPSMSTSTFILVSLVQYFSLICHLAPWLYCPVRACECSIRNPVARLKRITISRDFFTRAAARCHTCQGGACYSVPIRMLIA